MGDDIMNVTTETAAVAAVGVKHGKPADAGPSTVRRSASVAAIAGALVKVQAEIEDPTKNKKADAGTRGSYRYADLPEVLDAVRPVLSKYGLAVTQLPCELDDQPALMTLLLHTSGEWFETVVKLRPVKSDPQGVGSATSYARRYAILALCGIAADDDDDGAAAIPQRAQQQRPASATPVDNLELRKKAEEALRACKDRAAYLAVCSQLNTDVAAGKFSQADRDHLSAVSREVNAKYPAAKQTA